MEEKRYKIEQIFEMSNEDIVDLLNQQDKEIKQAKENLSKFGNIISEQTQRIKDLEEENKQLKEAQKQLAINELEKIEEILWDSQDIGNLIDNDKFLEKLNYLIKSLK